MIGKLSDVYGRKTVLLASMVGNALSMLIWIYADTFELFLLSRIIGGLTEGNVQMSVAMISDITHEEERSKSLALVGMAFAFGFTVGPPLGAYLTKFTFFEWMPWLKYFYVNEYSSPALFALILILVESVYLYLYLPETLNGSFKTVESDLNKEKNTMDSQEPLLVKKKSITTCSQTLKNRSHSLVKEEREPKQEHQFKTEFSNSNSNQLYGLSLIHFLFILVFSGMEFTLTFLTHDRFQFSHASQGRLLGFIGLSSALLQGLYVRRVKRKQISDIGLVLQGIGSCAIGMGIIGLSLYLPFLYIGALFLAFTSGTVVNGLTSLASLIDKEKGNLGRSLGIFRSFGQLGRSLGPLLFCSLYWIVGSSLAYVLASCYMIVLGIKMYFTLNLKIK